MSQVSGVPVTVERCLGRRISARDNRAPDFNPSATPALCQRLPRPASSRSPVSPQDGARRAGCGSHPPRARVATVSRWIMSQMLPARSMHSTGKEIRLPVSGASPTFDLCRRTPGIGERPEIAVEELMRSQHRIRSEAVRRRITYCADHAGLFTGWLVAIALGTSVAFAPQPLVLPFVATTMLIASALVAVHAWRRPAAAEPDRIGSWDVSGGYAFIGISAAELGDAEGLLALLSFGPP